MAIRGNLEKFPEGEARGKFFQIHEDFHIFTRGKGIYGHIHEKKPNMCYILFYRLQKSYDILVTEVLNNQKLLTIVAQW